MNFETFDIDSIPSPGKIRNPETRNELKKLLKSLIKEGEQIVKQSTITEDLPESIGKTKNTKSNKLQCPECENSFFSYENLRKHMVKVHEVDFLDEYEEEEITSSTSSSPVQDEKNLPGCSKTETINENTCDICLKQLTSKRSLALHKSLIHSKKKSVYVNQCTKCPKGFRNQKILMLHDYKEHGGKKVIYLCDICGKDLRNKYRLATHIKTKHEKSLSQVCPICGITLYMAGSIQQHINLHSDVRPFKCDQCDSAFKQKHDFTVHKRLHTGERPYKCRFCDGRFIANTNLHKHMKSAHKDLL